MTLHHSLLHHKALWSCVAWTRTCGRAQWQFGFTLPLDQSFSAEGFVDWEDCTRILGNYYDLENASVNDKRAFSIFCSNMISRTSIPPDLDDLSRDNHSYIASRINFDKFSLVNGWYILHEPRFQTACTWVLGVNNAAAALYVLRVLATSNRAHTVMTLAESLLRNGVAFRTFEPLAPKLNYPKISEPSEPKAYRSQGYHFTTEDFDGAWLHIKECLQSLQGRSALLVGGIIGRIAREFLSIDNALAGPSVEATYARHGLHVANEGSDQEYWDDDLSENEYAIICGTYQMYTGSGSQLTTVSWFPPQSAWKDGTYDSLEWTPYCENWFQMILREAREGRSQPQSKKFWRNALRYKHSRKLYLANRIRADTFWKEN